MFFKKKMKWHYAGHVYRVVKKNFSSAIISECHSVYKQQTYQAFIYYTFMQIFPNIYLFVQKEWVRHQEACDLFVHHPEFDEGHFLLKRLFIIVIQITRRCEGGGERRVN